ncbi:MAG TPA: Hsp20/alpha crystallin family protein [Sedimentisphaerales bacterium]|nr:Hsp20/alpha crystallin family protein [Sedimentisphaerales bacterium]
MAIVPWTRRNRNELSTLRGQMDDLFNSFFRGLDTPFSLLGERTWPAIDVAEKDDAVLVRAEVPGCKPEDIEISVYGNTLTLSGEKKESHEANGEGYYHMESAWGSFRREISLPAEVDQDKIEAVVKDGVLSVTLPKAEKSKAVKVKVQG